MARIRVERVVDAAPATVWDRLADIGDHVSWMADAERITFTGDRRQGVGTTFDCATRVGPLRTTDRMEVTEWRPGEALGVRHTGLVTGQGRFELSAAGRGRTRVVWDEDLRFPAWLGGPVAAAVAAPVLRRLWAGNLRRLAARLADRAASPPGPPPPEPPD